MELWDDAPAGPVAWAEDGGAREEVPLDDERALELLARGVEEPGTACGALARGGGLAARWDDDASAWSLTWTGDDGRTAAGDLPSHEGVAADALLALAERLDGAEPPAGAEWLPVETW